MSENQRIGEALNKRLAERGLLKVATAAYVCGQAKEIGRGDFVPISFKAGVLKVSVASGAKAHMLRLDQEDLIKKINEKLKSSQVKKIIFRVES